ncbi:hypothetical protein [Cereibacter changlensis]|nr:hypothetical protein [Cereibacter changlensis]
MALDMKAGGTMAATEAVGKAAKKKLKAADRLALVTLSRAPWDLGPLTPRQIAGKVIEPVTTVDPKTGKTSNPNGVIRTRRETWVERYLRKGKLSAAQANAAEQLAEAAQGRRGRDMLASMVKVDTSASDFDPAVAHLDRRRRFHAMWAAIPASCRPAVEHVVLNDHSLRSMAGCNSGKAEARYLDRLQRGLEALTR